MYLFSMIILIFFAVIGLCAFISALLDAVYRSGGQAELIITKLTPDSAEARIRHAARICQHHRDIDLVCVCKEGEPAYDICKLMQKEYPFMQIIPDETGKQAPP